jgi:predicted RNA-binding protein with PIN domain
MSIHIIIDGYNLIRQSDSLGQLDNQDIQLGRDGLIDMLSVYKRIKNHKITVVFDGINASFHSRHKDRKKGIEIKFSTRGESADHVIKGMVASERERALVVSSDLELIEFAAIKGAASISSSGFEKKIALAAYMDVKGIDDDEKEGWVPSTKKKGPKRRLSKRKRRNRIKISKL